VKQSAMGAPRELPPVGSYVEVIQGRDAGLIAVVLAHEGDRFVRIADGDVRRVEKPKKKNVAHVRRIHRVAETIAQKLAEGGRVTNAELRHAVRMLLEAQTANGQEREQGGT